MFVNVIRMIFKSKRMKTTLALYIVLKEDS